MVLLVVPLALVLLAALVGVVLYNGLVHKRNMTRNAFSTIDVMLKKRHELIPNLVETVKGFAAHEKDTFAKVIELRNQAAASEIDDAQRLRAESQIGVQIGRLLAVAEDYPELQSSDQFLNLQRNLTEVEEQISAARRAYNGAVLEVNNAVETFPSSLVATKFGFQKHDFFESDDDERASLGVKF